MTVSAANLVSYANNSTSSTYTSGSYSPTASRFLLCGVFYERNGSTPSTPTVAGNGLTWTQVADYIVTHLATPDGHIRRLTLFSALTGSAPTASGLTVTTGDPGSQLGCIIIVDQYSTGIGVTATTGIAQSKTGAVDSGAATSETITLSSGITAGNASVGYFTHIASEGNTAGSGYTLLGTANYGGAQSLGSEYKAAGSTTVDMSWASSVYHGGIAAELGPVTINFTPFGGTISRSLTA